MIETNPRHALLARGSFVHHVAPAVVVRFGDHAFHPEPALDALVRVDARHEEVFLHRAEDRQVLGDELRQAVVLLHEPAGLHARHQVVVLLGRVYAHLTLLGQRIHRIEYETTKQLPSPKNKKSGPAFFFAPAKDF